MIGRSMFAYIPVNIANLIVSFGTIVILTRLLGSEEFGRYALAAVTLHAFHMGVFSWLEASTARYQARAEREGDVNTHLKTIYTLTIITAIAAFITSVAVLYILPIEPILKQLLMFAIGSTCLQVFLNIGMDAHKAAHRIKRYSVTYSAHTLASFSIGILLILFTSLREVAPFIGIILSLCVVATIDLIFMSKQMKGGVFQAERVKPYLDYGMPICISLLLAYALNSADLYIIAGMIDAAAAGQYNAGYNLANRSVELIFAWVAMAATPMAVTLLEKEGVKRSQDVMRDYAATLLWITMPAATGIALVSKDLGFILGTSVRAEAITIMPLIAFAGVLNGLISYYVQRAFMLSARTTMFIWALLPPFLINIGLNIWLIPIYGMMGAVYATLIAYAIGLVLSILIARRFYPLPVPIKACLQIMLACIAMAGAIMLLPGFSGLPDPIRLAIKISTGIVVYATVSLSMNTANSQDLALRLYAQYKLKKAASI